MLSKCLSISHITLYVSNARQAALNYCFQYGFRPFRYRGLESGDRLQASHAVINNDVVLVFTSPLIYSKLNDHINHHIATHGDAVKDIAFNVESVDEMVRQIQQTSDQPVRQWSESDANGTVKYVNVSAFGDTTHTLIERNGYPRNLFLPGWQSSPLESALKNSIWSELSSIDLQFIDHLAANQIYGQMSKVVKWYERVLGFRRYWSADDTIIETQLSGLKSVFVTNANQQIKIPVVEAKPGPRRSQIQEFLDYNYGPGVQHIAFNTSDICDTVAKLRHRGVEFLSTPDTYYIQLRERLRKCNLNIIDHDIDRLKKLNILMDFDNNGYLLQIFTKPVEDRPTLFFELIERHNYNGFGAGNIKALFEAVEAQQQLRGNL
ncbi:4-hydroxyphenylpyruvate dioxygenase-like [Oppia nitens]|uniref:4-hydroxyphenylpyruvate dioxygenase-like n=1 Tax=Oppia nitens TaxID=1686743 RepID=UPI0023DB7614|nr:4-hydroxyphenylpyruvate dioxygenase-like [Oppia nitens]